MIGNKRVWALFLGLGLVVAACGGGEDASTTTGADGGDTGGEAIQLTLQHMEVPPNRVEAFQEVIDGFNAQSDQYEVTQQTVGWGEAYSRATAQIAADEAPDMLQAIPAFFTTIRETGAVQPATEIFNDLAEKHSFLPAMVEQYEWDGEVWAVPAWSMVEVLWYNVDHFEEAGLDAPETWSDVLNAAETLTTGDRYGIAVPAGDSFATLQAIYTWMAVNDAFNIYDDACNPIVDTEETVEAFEFYNQLVQYSPPDSPSYQWAEVESALVAQRASMITFKGSFLRAWTEAGHSPDSLAAVPIPVPDDGGVPTSLSYSNAIMVMTDDPQKQEGIEAFLDYFLQPDVYGKWLGEAEPGLFLPVTEEAEEADTFWEAEVIAPFVDEMQTQIDVNRTSKQYGFTQDAYCSQVGEFEGQFLLAKAVERMVVGGMSPEEAVDWLQAEMESVGA